MSLEPKKHKHDNNGTQLKIELLFQKFDIGIQETYVINRCSKKFAIQQYIYTSLDLKILKKKLISCKTMFIFQVLLSVQVPPFSKWVSLHKHLVPESSLQYELASAHGSV